MQLPGATLTLAKRFDKPGTKCRVAFLSLVTESKDGDEELEKLLELIQSVSKRWHLERVLISDIP